MQCPAGSLFSPNLLPFHCGMRRYSAAVHHQVTVRVEPRSVCKTLCVLVGDLHEPIHWV